MEQPEFSTSNKENQQNHLKTPKRSKLKTFYKVVFGIGKVFGIIIKSIMLLFKGFIEEASKPSPTTKNNRKHPKRKNRGVSRTKVRFTPKPQKTKDPFENFFDS